MAISHNVKVLKAQNFNCWRSGEPRQVAMSNFVKIGPFIREILSFFNFSK